MKLDSLLSYKTSFQLTKIITITVIVLFTIALVVGYLVMMQKLSNLQEKIIVIDKKGEVYESVMAKANEMRVYEYENHVRTFFNLWYAFDENSYKGNIEKALLLVGECGKEMLNQYRGEEVERKLIQKNLKLEVTIKDLKIDMSSNPVSGYIIGIQVIKRSKGEVARNLKCKFIIYDVDRSRENPHGCKIDNWKVIDASIVN